MGGLLSGHMLLERNPDMLLAEAGPGEQQAHAGAGGLVEETEEQVEVEEGAEVAAVWATGEQQHGEAELEAAARGDGVLEEVGGQQEVLRDGELGGDAGSAGAGDSGRDAGAGADVGSATGRQGRRLRVSADAAGAGAGAAGPGRSGGPRYDGVFLRRAVELADRLLPAFDTPSGLPALFVNLQQVGGRLAAGAGHARSWGTACSGWEACATCSRWAPTERIRN